ncbi:electron transfer flavoprotein subunit beta [Zavarzinia compransoris]|uniref:Electron transfer flavoprotein subunit beta n=1 Tax=Zavarzinia compransoris TaxID=1264899 RepID=A0A317DTP2_9PROT|nr:electron transfer flavoprotein subunit beta [Zavarzinia compransoris]PWR18058.1 electron transfer flavoprotein subunit beta [Zavarzinia compransoris]TDP43470.1 electron transfer flavoprotein beta subunit [Zavarzinia compransoris]
MIVALLSRALHPVSGRPCPSPLDTRAVRLGLGLGPVIGLHAGPADEAIGDYLGHGLDLVRRLDLPAGTDPLPALAADLAAAAPMLILAGQRAQGGEDSGQLPYLLAARLGLPLVAGATAIARDGAAWTVEQALPRGARRRTTLAGPLVVTIHPAAPAGLPFAAGARRRGRVETIATAISPPTPPPEPEPAEHPYRRRPRLITAATAGERRLLIQPPATEAAAAILAQLTAWGLILKP